MGCQRDAQLCDEGVEFGEGIERSVDDGLVDEDPEGLGGLKFRRVGRQESQPDARRYGKIGRSVPPSIVENDDDDFVRSSSGFSGKQRQEFFEQAFRDAVRQIEKAVPGLW